MKKIIVYFFACLFVFTTFSTGINAYAADKQSYSASVTVSSVKLKSKKLVYNGKARNVSVVAVNNRGDKIPKKYYTVKYNKSRKNRVDYGKYRVTVKFKKPYSGKKKLTYYIVAKNQRAYVTKVNKKSVVFKIKDKPKTNGYHLQVSSHKDFPDSKTTSIKIVKGTKTVKGLKSNKTYYYRTRSYTVVGGSTVYSRWSKIRSVKTLKSNTSQPANELIPGRIRKNSNGKYELYVTEYTIWDENTGKYILKKINNWTSSEETIEYFLEDRSSYDSDSCTAQKFLAKLYKVYTKINLNGNESDYEKFFTLVRWFEENYSYAYNSNGKPDENYHTSYDLIVYKKAVCDGYAALFTDLCYLVSLDCKYITGKTSSLHAWNALKINGNWYQYEPQNDFTTRSPLEYPKENEPLSETVIQELRDMGYTEQQIYDMQHNDGVDNYAKRLFLIDSKTYKLGESYNSFWSSCQKGTVDTVRNDLTIMKTAYKNATNHQFKN